MKRCGSSHHCQGCKQYKRYLNWIYPSSSKSNFNFIEMWINIEVNGLEEYFSIQPKFIYCQCQILKGRRVRQPHHLRAFLQRALDGCQDDVLPERQGQEDGFIVGRLTLRFRLNEKDDIYIAKKRRKMSNEMSASFNK